MAANCSKFMDPWLRACKCFEHYVHCCLRLCSIKQKLCYLPISVSNVFSCFLYWFLYVFRQVQEGSLLVASGSSIMSSTPFVIVSLFIFVLGGLTSVVAMSYISDCLVLFLILTPCINTLNTSQFSMMHF